MAEFYTPSSIGPLVELVQTIASLRLVGEPDEAAGGRPFEPTEGADDSHETLMRLIGQARERMRASKESAEEQQSPPAVAYREAAGELHAKDGELEVDDNAVVSFGDDEGAYVQAWVWVPFGALPADVRAEIKADAAEFPPESACVDDHCEFCGEFDNECTCED